MGVKIKFVSDFSLAFFIRQIRQKELLQICNFRKNAEIEKKLKLHKFHYLGAIWGNWPYILLFFIWIYMLQKGIELLKTLYFLLVFCYNMQGL